MINLNEQFIHNAILKKAVSKEYNQQELGHIKYLQEEILIDFYLNREAMNELNKIQITEEELKNIYEENKENYMVQKKYKINTIFLSTEEKAEKVLKEVNAKNFLEVLEKYNEKKKGMKEEEEYIPASNIKPEILAVLEKAKRRGLIKKIIPVDDGFHIVNLLDREDERQASFDEVKNLLLENIRKNLHEKIVRNLMQTIVEEAKKEEEKKLEENKGNSEKEKN